MTQFANGCMPPIEDSDSLYAAFLQGKDAYYAGRDSDANPFPAGSPTRRSWREGWTDAHDEDSE